MLMPLSMAGSCGVEAHVQWLESSGEIIEHDCHAVGVGVEVLLGHPSINIGVNVSPKSMRKVLEIMVAIPLDVSARMVIEITENLLEDKKTASQFMLILSRMGTKVAVDDYGSGVREGLGDIMIGGFLPDIIKFASTCIPRKHIENVMSYSARLGIATVMEKIEDNAMLRLCDEFGIHYGQGYFLDGKR